MIYYIYNQNILFKIIVDFTWKVSDCEELVGITLRWCGIIARSSGF